MEDNHTKKMTRSPELARIEDKFDASVFVSVTEETISGGFYKGRRCISEADYFLGGIECLSSTRLVTEREKLNVWGLLVGIFIIFMTLHVSCEGNWLYICGFGGVATLMLLAGLSYMRKTSAAVVFNLQGYTHTIKFQDAEGGALLKFCEIANEAARKRRACCREENSPAVPLQNFS